MASGEEQRSSLSIKSRAFVRQLKYPDTMLLVQPPYAWDLPLHPKALTSRTDPGGCSNESISLICLGLIDLWAASPIRLAWFSPWVEKPEMSLFAWFSVQIRVLSLHLSVHVISWRKRPGGPRLPARQWFIPITLFAAHSVSRIWWIDFKNRKFRVLCGSV